MCSFQIMDNSIFLEMKEQVTASFEELMYKDNQLLKEELALTAKTEGVAEELF